MRKILAATVILAPLISGCAYWPSPIEPVNFDDSPVDVRACRRLGRVGGPYPTSPGFVTRIDEMRDATRVLGGTDLLLSRRIRRDWSFVEGTAYRCPTYGREPTTVIRVSY